MNALERLIREREPDPQMLERERLIGMPPRYEDPRFYEPLETIVFAGIEAALAGRR